MTAWRRLTQPKKEKDRRASGGGSGSIAGACPRDRPRFKGGRAWGIVGPEIGPRFPRPKPPRMAWCAKTRPMRLRGLAVVKLEQAAESLTTFHLAVPITVVLGAMSALPRPWCGRSS